MADPGKYFCPRLVDYVLIAGQTNPTTDSETPQNPELLRRYPEKHHDDFMLPSNIQCFCQPEGCTTIGAKQMSHRDRHSFVFAITDKESGRRRYGVCLNFYRPFKRKYGVREPVKQQTSVESTSSAEGGAAATQKSRVKSRLKSHTLTTLCIISHHAMFSTFRECLTILARLIDVCNSAASKKKQGGRRLQ